jgi:YfiH family protein
MDDGFIEPDWLAPARVRAVASTRRAPGASAPPFERCNLGARSGDDPQQVMANRAALAAALALPSSPHWLHQVHGTGVLRIDAPLATPRPIDAEPQADAAVTAVPGAVLAVLSADCLPMLFAAEDGSVIGAAHAGWRGLAAGVLEATVAAMAMPPERVLAWFGPAIGAASYEVGDEVRAAFVAGDPEASAAFVATRPGHWRCDLYALARLRLRRLGLRRVGGGDRDTVGEPAWFHSHRRDGAASGRQATLIWLALD